MSVNRRYAAFAWGVLGYSVLVILWGAFVRATGSGAGCGSHWPLCNGVVVPRAAQVETIVEFAHRLTSGLSLVLIAALIVWGWRVSRPGHPVRKTLIASGVFIILEALIGAWLVLAGLTAGNDSVGRAVSMALHLINTFFLLASLALTAWWASGGEAIRLRGQGWLLAGWLLALAAVLIVGMSGAVTALGDTLFPSANLTEGFQADFSPTAHILVRARVLHPMLAVGYAVFAVLLARPDCGQAARRPDAAACKPDDDSRPGAGDGGRAEHRAAGPGLDADRTPGAGRFGVAVGRAARRVGVCGQRAACRRAAAIADGGGAVRGVTEMAFDIRPARLEDADALAEFLKELHHFARLEPLSLDAVRAQVRRHLDAVPEQREPLGLPGRERGRANRRVHQRPLAAVPVSAGARRVRVRAIRGRDRAGAAGRHAAAGGGQGGGT